MRLRIPLAVLVAPLLSAACATAPRACKFEPVAAISADYDSVCAAVVEYFAVSELPLEILDRNSGRIVTSWLNAGNGLGGENRSMCACGGPGWWGQLWTRGRFSVFITSAAARSTDLRVTCTYDQQRGWSVVKCESTGYLEKQLQDYVRARVACRVPPPVQKFAPGHMP